MDTEFIIYLIDYFQTKQVTHTIYTFIDSAYDECEILRMKYIYNYENPELQYGYDKAYYNYVQEEFSIELNNSSILLFTIYFSFK